MNYVIESVRNRDGSVHERELRRKGHGVNIAVCNLGVPLIYSYPNDGDAWVRTSPVENVLAGDGKLVVWTQNTVYTFRKITEVSE